MPDLPSFDNAQSQLIAFVGAVTPCAKVRWVFREDFYGRNSRQVIVPRNVPSPNSALARRVYEQGARADHGVKLHAEFCHDGCASCWVDVPLDGDDAQERMIAGLKLSYRDPLPLVVQVGAVSWLWHRVVSLGYRRQLRENQFVPLRAKVLRQQAAAEMESGTAVDLPNR